MTIGNKASPVMITPPELRARLERAVEHAAARVRALVEREPGFFPIYTKGGRWRHEGELWTDWCAGFLTGMLWTLHEQTGESWWRQRAEEYSRLLEPKKDDRAVHDLGFIFLNTYLPWYRLTGDEAQNAVLIRAGKILALRFRPKGGYLCSFIGSESLFIDIMMNVPLIFYAARESGDRQLFELARTHCRTTERALVRPNGGTAHEGIFDLETGEFLRQSTHQGLSAESDWTRGLAWSLYGFGTVYGYTDDPADLAVAQRNADHFMDRLPESKVPPWDFDAPPGPTRLDDSSAGAIAASGLWNLARLTRDSHRADRYRRGALELLDALCTDRYVSWNEPQWEGVLKHGVYHIHKGLGVDESVMWGEFFFLEAVCKALSESGSRLP